MFSAQGPNQSYDEIVYILVLDGVLDREVIWNYWISQGEWYYNPSNGNLYLWASSGVNPKPDIY